MKKILFALVILPIFCCASYAQNADKNKPVEITADESLEWHRTELYFLARKNVKAMQGDTVLVSELLTAKYREDAQKSINIYTIIAQDNVVITSPQSKVYGDKAVYDVDKGYAIVTGNSLKLVSTDQTVTARDRFEYWNATGKLIATGNAVAVREGDTIKADKLIAIFTQGTGKRTLKSLEAIGNVVITTPDEVLRGDRATYDAASSTAQLFDNVKITRGPNVLEGTKAVLNTKTNVSKLFGGTVSNNDGTQSSGGRVRGVFYPGSEKKPEIQNQQ